MKAQVTDHILYEGLLTPLWLRMTPHVMYMLLVILDKIVAYPIFCSLRKSLISKLIENKMILERIKDDELVRQIAQLFNVLRDMLYQQRKT